MDFLEKLNRLMDEEGLNKNSLSQASGIPYTTIDGWYKKGFANAKLPTIQKIADYFNTTLDYLIRDEIEDRDFGKTHGFSITLEEQQLIKKYRELDAHGKDSIDWMIYHEWSRCENDLENRIPEIISEAETRYTKIIPFPGKVSAGLGVEAIENYDTITGPNGADFALIVDGDSMEPDFHDSQIIYIQQTNHVESGQIAIIQVFEPDDYFPRAYLKKVKLDSDTYTLVSLNNHYSDMVVNKADAAILGVVIA